MTSPARLLLCTVAAAIASAHTAPPARAAKYLVLDDRVIGRTENAHLVLGRVEKAPENPLFEADRPWENSLNNLYPNVLFDEATGRYRLWYKCVLADKDAIAKMRRPSTVHNVGWYLLHATSPDGIHWTRPLSGRFPFNGRPTNAVARDTPNVGVFKDTRADCPADRRYKMIYDVGRGKMRVRFSPDGLHWTDPVVPEGLGNVGDTHNNAWWDPDRQAYVLITRIYRGQRLVARSESEDFLHWTAPTLAITPRIGEGRHRQMYCMPSFRYAGIYLGYLMMYNAGGDRSVDCELTWSPDSVRWHRVCPGRSLIPRGPKGACDSMCIYAPSGPPIIRDGKIEILYGGSDLPHRGWKRHCLPCMARLRVDGFAGYAPADDNAPAVVVTDPVRCTGEPIRITADAESGRVRVGVLGERPLDACTPIAADVTDAAVTWNADASSRPLKGRTVRLVFELTGATLYAFSGVERAAVVRTDSFTDGADGWSAVAEGRHRPDGGDPGGYVTVTRPDGARPFAVCTADAAGGAFVGDLTKRYAGRGAEISFSVRSAQGAAYTRLEIFGDGVGQWVYDGLAPPGKDWSKRAVRFRYDWTDAEARAAGWSADAIAAPWRETVRHVEKIVVLVPARGKPATFDLDEFRIRADLEAGPGGEVRPGAR